MVEAQQWHPAAAEADLRDRPLAANVLGRELVLWRDGAGRAHAFDDRCPHRGASLSLGRVQGDMLQCAYHGWCFGGDGRCRHVPAVPRFDPPAGHAATAHRVAASHGMLFVQLGGETPTDPRHQSPPRLDGLPPREIVCGPYDAATSAPRVVENFLDMSHFGFVHDGYLGDGGHLEVPDHAVTLTADGRPVVEHYRAWQPRASAHAAGGAWVDYRYEVLGPYTALLRKRADAGARPDAPDEAYALWAVPLDDERTRVWFTLFTSDAGADAAVLRGFQDTIFLQDKPVIESQRPRRLPVAGGEVASACDRLSAAYRRYLLALGVRCGIAG